MKVTRGCESLIGQKPHGSPVTLCLYSLSSRDVLVQLLLDHLMTNLPHGLKRVILGRYCPLVDRDPH